MPNRFQSELAKNHGVIGGRRWSWQAARGQRLPVELRPRGGGFARNEIFGSNAQRAFAVLDSAGAWRRLAAEYGASGDLARASACKRAAHEHLFRAVRARAEAEKTICEPILDAPPLAVAVSSLSSPGLTRRSRSEEQCVPKRDARVKPAHNEDRVQARQ